MGEPAADNQRRRVLYIGPDPATGRLLMETLQQTSHHALEWEVTVHSDLHAARSAIEAGSTDAVIFSPTGEESVANATATLAETTPAVPIVVLGNGNGHQRVGPLLRAGALDVLSPDDLTNGTLARVLSAATRPAPRRDEPDLGHLVRATPDALLVTNTDGLICFANPAAEALFDRDSNTLLGREFGFPIMSEETSEIEVVRPGRTVITAEMRCARVQWEGESAYLVTLRDVTRIRAAEHDLRRATKMEAIGRLTAGVAHYCNNKLAVIRGFSDLLLSKTPENDPRGLHIKQLRNATKQLSRLISHLLSFGRRQILNPRRVEPNDVIAELRQSMTSLLGANIPLELDLSNDAWQIDVDPTLLEEAILSVISNASDAMPEGGTVLLRTRNKSITEEEAGMSLERLPGRYLVIEVTDTGEGMDTGTLDRIFEPFFTTRELHAGRGLGLAMVHGFVSQSGGFVEVDSVPMRGTTVRLFIPQGCGPEPSGGDARSRKIAKPPGTKATLLVAENNAAIRTFIAHTLRTRGYHVLEAASGLQALLQSESCTGSLDLLIADVVMPAMNGATIAHRIQRLRPDVSVLYLSPYSERILHREQLISPSARVLIKPFGAKMLIEAVRKALNGGA